MILRKEAIVSEMEKGNIKIDPFFEDRLNPNSYNVTLADELLVYKKFPLDIGKKNDVKKIKIPEKGIVLKPGRLYLGFTQEWTETQGLVPKIEGRSSIGRLGLFIHVTAGFGDVGFRGRWTLELFAIHSVRVFAGSRIAQISYYRPEGNGDSYSGKYQDAETVQASRIERDRL